MAFQLRRARFFDESGEFHGIKTFNKNAKTFDYGSGAYNVIEKNPTFIEDYPYIFPFFARRKTYLYNVGDPNPITLGLNHKPIMHPELYNIQIKTNVAKQLNNLSKPNKFADLPWVPIGIGVILLCVLVYYAISGGKFTA